MITETAANGTQSDPASGLTNKVIDTIAQLGLAKLAPKPVTAAPTDAPKVAIPPAGLPPAPATVAPAMLGGIPMPFVIVGGVAAIAVLAVVLLRK